MTDIPLPEDEPLAEIVREAAASWQVAYLTDGSPQGRRVLGARAAGCGGRHDVSEHVEEILRSEVTP